MYTVMLNRNLKTDDMNRIDMYSAKKIITNGTELNSVLNPLTSSDSPSEKSNGARLVSAREVTRRININIYRKGPRTLYLVTLSW